MTKITIAKGDGIGPEIMDATLSIIKAAGAAIEIEEISIGEQEYLSGNPSGIHPDAWRSLRTNRVFLKAPITTPQGGGYKSVNVTIRKMLGMYANVRPCTSYHPFIRTKHPVMDLVIIRENEEDLYAGIEHQQTDEVVQCLKIMSRPGTEKIVRYAFEYAKAHGRRKVTCFTKDNIMKLTDGMFHKVFDEIGAEYPDLQKEHWIVDIGAAKLADTPEIFDVIVLPNLYGDILSDVAAQITGSVGIAGSANIGENFAMFEAIHGSAPRIAGMGKANPSGLLFAAIQMLVHIGQPRVAAKIHNAWLKTLEDGLHTYDIYKEGFSNAKLGTMDFAKAVIAHLGEEPSELKKMSFGTFSQFRIAPRETQPAKKELVGVDIFLHHTKRDPEELAAKLLKLPVDRLGLYLITNRGTKVWPGGFPETFCTDHWRCRFKALDHQELSYKDVIRLLEVIDENKFSIIKTENLYKINGEPGYTAAQGQ